jgi:GTP-binding protein
LTVLARPDWVVDQVFDLFVNLDATDEQLDFPIVYASALNGIAGLDHEDMAEDMTPLYQAIVDRVPAPNVDLDGTADADLPAGLQQLRWRHRHRSYQAR